MEVRLVEKIKVGRLISMGKMTIELSSKLDAKTNHLNVGAMKKWTISTSSAMHVCFRLPVMMLTDAGGSRSYTMKQVIFQSCYLHYWETLGHLKIQMKTCNSIEGLGSSVSCDCNSPNV